MSKKNVKYLVMVAILVVTSMLCSVPTYANLLNNSGFEQGNTTDWSTSGGGTLMESTAQAYSGSYSGSHE